MFLIYIIHIYIYIFSKMKGSDTSLRGQGMICRNPPAIWNGGVSLEANRLYVDLWSPGTRTMARSSGFVLYIRQQ